MKAQVSASELRIGNIVLFLAHDTTWKEYLIESAIDLAVIEETPQAFQPIELNEEWLVNKFDARVYDANYKWFELCNDFKLRFDVISGGYAVYINGKRFGKRTIFYVHDLMNLYFWLTGQELSLKVSGEYL